MSTQQHSSDSSLRNRIKIIPFIEKWDPKTECEDLSKDPILQSSGGIYADTDLRMHYNGQTYPVFFDPDKKCWQVQLTTNPLNPDFDGDEGKIEPTLTRGQQIRVWSDLQQGHDVMEEVD